MKTNIFITTIVLVLGAFFTFSQAQTDKTITRNESVSQFSSIRFEAVGDVNFEQSSEYSLRIEGPRKFVEKVLVKVKNGELILTYKEQNNKSKRVKFYITAPDLSRVNMEGVGAFRCEKKLEMKDLELNMSKGNSFIEKLIRIADLECKTLRARMEGIGKINVHVHCVKLVAKADGVGHMTLSGYARSADVTSDGIGGVNTRNLQVGE